MAIDIVSVGNKIELRDLHAVNTDGAQQVYVSQLLDFSREVEDSLIIAMPILEGRLVPLPTGRSYEACFNTNKGLYKADCVITNRGKAGNIYVLEIQLKTRLQKFQRREYFRLTCDIDMDLRLLNEEEKIAFLASETIPEEVQQAPERVNIIDISGGGVRFISTTEYERDDLVFLTIYLDNTPALARFEVMGCVVQSTASKNVSNVFETRIQFKINDKDKQERLVKYIFEEQRRRMQKGR